MVKALLVGPDNISGNQILEALDAADLDVKVAAYMYPDEYQDWRLFLASPKLDKSEHEYGAVHDAFRNAGIPFDYWPTLMIRNMSDPTVRELRQRFRKDSNAEGRRIGGHSIGGRFIEDGIIYRVR